MFSKSSCRHCKEAKKLFLDLYVDYYVMDLDKVPNGDIIQKALKEMTGVDTLHYIYIGEKYVGGSP